MKSVRPLLVLGNGKLGAQIAHFDLPAGGSYCPGRSTVCEAVCYAQTGRYRFPQVRSRLLWNYQQSLRSDFADRVIHEIRRKGLMTIRLHCSGDVYEARYAEQWTTVFRACPRVTFYVYTRSYRVPEIAAVLEHWPAERRVRLWYSVDEEAWPERVPPGVRLAFLQTQAGQLATGAHLVFRVSHLRRHTVIGLPMVCPTETQAGHAQGLTCGSCQHCFS